MRSIFLTIFVIGSVFLYVQIETISKSQMATPLTKQLLIKRKTKDVITNQVAYAPDSYLMAVGTPDGKLTVWDKNFEDDTLILQEKSDAIIHLIFSNDENWLLSTGSKGKVQLWNINSNHLVRTFQDLKQQGYLNDFLEFVEVDTFSESLVFINKDGKAVYYNYETEQLFYKAQIPVATY